MITAALLLTGAALWLLGLWLSTPVTIALCVAAAVAVLQLWRLAARPLPTGGWR